MAELSETVLLEDSGGMWPSPDPFMIGGREGDMCNNSFGINSTLIMCNLTYENRTYNNDTATDSIQLIIMGVTSVFLGLLILMTVIGNVFVIAAILLERNLQSVANYLIVSLAVADLMVACLVMPLGAVYEISRGWILGPELCDMWTSSDVLCCTASILHLVAIAVDRYWAVTNVDYIHSRNVNRIGGMIVVVWAVALVVSLAPQFGWKDPDYLDRINLYQKCLVSQDIAYQIFATCSTFYVPLLVILVLYWKIFQTARKRIRKNRKDKPGSGSNIVPSNNSNVGSHRFLPKKRFRRLKRNSKKSTGAEALVSSVALVEGQSTTTIDEVTETHKSSDGSSETKIQTEEPHQDKSIEQVTTAFTITKCGADDIPTITTSNNISPEKSSSGGTTNNGSASHQSHISDISRVEMLSAQQNTNRGEVNLSTKYGTATAIVKAVNPMQLHREKKESLEAKRERKAAKTLAIITGAFVVCWLPFFITALLMPLCQSCEINEHLASFFLWLGYFNSTLNPVIYTVFSPEFRQAFKRMLCGAPRRNPHYRHGR